MGAPKITAEQLERWLELDRERKQLEQRARLLKRDQELLNDVFDVALKAAGLEKLKRGHCQVQYVDGQVSVSWKDEFMRFAGAEKLAEVAQAAADKPPPKKIQVVRLGEQTSAPAA